MRSTLVAVLAAIACGGGGRPRSMPPPSASERACTDDTTLLVELAGACNDLRGGLSGWVIVTVVDGAHRGKLLMHSYRNEPASLNFADRWAVVRATIQPTLASSQWDNQCQLGAKEAAYDGTIVEAQVFANEAAARAEYEAKRCAQPSASSSASSAAGVVSK